MKTKKPNEGVRTFSEMFPKKFVEDLQDLFDKNGASDVDVSALPYHPQSILARNTYSENEDGSFNCLTEYLGGDSEVLCEVRSSIDVD